ncbi:hypothetical protein CKO38_09815 [Rhodospirillum rubrum]|uniref:FxsA family protein n=1 Tax=Rhodospirillum rubrum TaxID=1085 RepID=UPI00190521CE|nr:FxsA family protein [Rhodospirillum rubrum]MBK1663215.1 hypothetical protein [Rhodospirillum rubrum]MBK1676956.1 hypothetical protein [Rhodospirillum rubrum]
MGIALFALFVGLPIAEIATFIKVGEVIGAGPTVGLVILSALAGVALIRFQGLITLTRARAALDAGALPVKEIFDGACLLASGFLLAIPGFVTDVAALLLLIAPIRDALRGVLAKRLQTSVSLHGLDLQGGAQAPFGPGPGLGPQPDGGKGPVIDGDFVEVEVEASSEQTRPVDLTKTKDTNPWAKKS